MNENLKDEVLSFIWLSKFETYVTKLLHVAEMVQTNNTLLLSK